MHGVSICLICFMQTIYKYYIIPWYNRFTLLTNPSRSVDDRNECSKEIITREMMSGHGVDAGIHACRGDQGCGIVFDLIKRYSIVTTNFCQEEEKEIEI